MNPTAAMVNQLCEEFDETIKPGPRPAAAPKAKRNRKASVDVFAPPASRSKTRTRIIAEVSSDIGHQFKDLCRDNGWSQKDIIEKFLREFVSRNG